MEKTVHKGQPLALRDIHGAAAGEEVSPVDRLISKLHKQADSCGCCVELGHLVLVHDAPQAAHIRVCGNPLKLTPMKAGHSQSFPTVPHFLCHSPRLSILPFLIHPCLHSLTDKPTDIPTDIPSQYTQPLRIPLSPGNRSLCKSLCP